ncbi:hypothetical protein [Flavobacterium hydatis]|uniref:Uncharacterized protein n=1 Tax=Flavobacterium hydatis TaxID=991 RepID=A0A086A0X3_FLAHY|nr:hypothetical protein [Flavobacterium hydatis]KFF10337.1 hypothetical protein IW20_20915 [Flavobacterium hydatis]OXA92676.1 hypothetical protein B0A62_14845 [Flavobacterium hydatis]
MKTNELQNNAFFTVSLDGIKLTKEQINNIDKGIKRVVMSEIAQIDHEGDLIVNRKLELNPRLKGLKLPILLGIWMEPFNNLRK